MVCRRGFLLSRVMFCLCYCSMLVMCWCEVWLLVWLGGSICVSGIVWMLLIFFIGVIIGLLVVEMISMCGIIWCLLIGVVLGLRFSSLLRERQVISVLCMLVIFCRVCECWCGREWIGFIGVIFIRLLVVRLNYFLFRWNIRIECVLLRLFCLCWLFIVLVLLSWFWCRVMWFSKQVVVVV